MQVLVIIKNEQMRRPIDCLYISLSKLLISDAAQRFPAIHCFDEDSNLEFTFFDEKFSFPSGICENLDMEIFISDHNQNCLFKFNVLEKHLETVVGTVGVEGKKDGRITDALLSNPVTIANRRNTIYIAEHPVDIQSAVLIIGD